MKRFILLFIILEFLIFTGCSTEKKSKEVKPRYTPDYVSLSKHNQQPDWFQNAKLGIYFHWGVYSVPAFGNEWYPRRMHFEDDITYQHHQKTNGHLSEFGYHDFVPMFKAENFDATEWAALFKKADRKSVDLQVRLPSITTATRCGQAN